MFVVTSVESLRTRILTVVELESTTYGIVVRSEWKDDGPRAAVWK